MECQCQCVGVQGVGYVTYILICVCEDSVNAIQPLTVGQSAFDSELE
jgi:hypothetical protein